MIYFLHVHKGGGTTFVNVAYANVERFPHPNANGNPLTDKGEFIEFWEFDPDKRLEYLLQYDFISHEAPITRPLLKSDQIKYVTILRHPLDLIYSEYKHSSAANPEVGSFENYIENAIWWNVPWSRSPLINTFGADKGEQAAYLNIDQFHSVMFLDTFADDIQVMKELAGWNILDINKYRGGTTSNTDTRKELAGTPLLKRLEKELERDIEFYHEMRMNWRNGQRVK